MGVPMVEMMVALMAEMTAYYLAVQ